MDFQTRSTYRGFELWINGKYHGTYDRNCDALRYVWELATGQLDPEDNPQQRLEWD
jgi:hypothetical protein